MLNAHAMRVAVRLMLMVWPLTPHIDTPVVTALPELISPPNRDEVGNEAANPRYEVDEFAIAPPEVPFSVTGSDNEPWDVSNTK